MNMGYPPLQDKLHFIKNIIIEWQIGYDVDKSDKEKLALSTLEYTEFIGANGKRKALYELSEYLYYFVQWEIITKNEIDDLRVFLQNIKEYEFLDSRSDLQILRIHPVNKKILDIEFCHSEVKYPLLVHKFNNSDILIEIIIKEKQRAVGIQPMLYVCFPITDLQTKDSLLGRVAESKEYGLLVLDSSKKIFLLEIFKIFGILSKNHRHDILEILKIII